MAKIMRVIASSFRENADKIMALLTILFLIISVSIGVRSYYLTKTLIPLYEQKLQKKLDGQVAIINKFLDQKMAKVIELGDDPVILDYLEKLFLKEQISPRAQQKFANYIAQRQENTGFESLSLVTAGIIGFSTNALMDKVNLRDPIYGTRALFRSYFIASLTLTTDFSAFVYSPLTREPVFFIVRTLIGNKKVLGQIVYQVDDQEINSITRDYLDLGTTGEIVLAVQQASQASFITPTRHDPTIRFTEEGLYSESNFIPMQRAARGESGHGIELDYRGQKILAVWSFIPRVDWGIVVKIDLQEVTAPISSGYKYLIIFSILTIISAVLLILLRRKTIAIRLVTIRQKIFGFIPEKIRLTDFILLFIFLFLSVLSIYQYRNGLSVALERSQNLAIQKVEKGVSAIENDLETIRILADFIAQDLRTERLISEDIKKRLTREIVEVDGIVRITIAYAPYQYSDKKKLYAPSITQKADLTILEEQIGELYDYTNKNEGLLRTSWYTEAIESQKPVWVNPSIDPVRKERVITYAVPFYFDKKEKTPAGVIAIAYKLKQFVEIAQYIGIGKTGYTFIMSNDQKFLSHPISQNVSEKKTLQQYAQEEGNPELEFIAKDIQEGKTGLKKFSTSSMTSAWIYTRPINITGWTLATVFSANEIGLAPKIIKDYAFEVTIYLTITLLLILLILCRLYARNPMKSFFNYSNIILIISIICLWYAIDDSSVESVKNIIITDEASVNKFINKQTQEAARKNEPTPVAIPCGIELYSLQQTNPVNVAFSGYIWHRYHKTLHKDIPRTIRIPQATSYSVLSETKVTEGDWEIIGSNFSATIYHEQEYAQYPFEHHNIVIPLEHVDIGKNVLLVPDVAAYRSINPQKLPGLDTTFSLTKFYSTETYFDYTPYKPESDFGVRKQMELSNQYRLAYNAVINVDLLAPFIYFFLPLLVILISIFAVLMLATPRTSGFTTIGPYTGLFFGLVILHRSLHEAAPAAHTLYMEYAFFYTYLILILLVINTLFAQRFVKSEFYQKVAVNFFKIIFWPLQLIAWIITTIIIFY